MIDRTRRPILAFVAPCLIILLLTALVFRSSPLWVYYEGDQQ